MGLAHDWHLLYCMQRAVRYYGEGHDEVSWYWLLEWAANGGRL